MKITCVTIIIHLLILTLCPCRISLAVQPSPVLADDDCPKIDRLIENGGLILAEDGRPLCAVNPDTAFVPASIWKIATSLAALNILGPDFRFITRFYLSPENDLYVQGFGDPFLVSEEVAWIMFRLRQRGVKKIRNIVLDDSSFRLVHAADGRGGSLNPYDAANSALAVNFNTVKIMVGKDGSVRSAEDQTPTLPMMTVAGDGLRPGVQRINISNNPAVILRYVGELFRAMQGKNHITGEGTIGRGRVPGNLSPIYIHHSRIDLESAIKSMLKYSTNFIANQIYLACGAEKFGYPATWDKAQAALQGVLAGEVGLVEREITVAEGSGLSRKNRVTPRAMTAILDRFKPYARLLPARQGDLIKSGTLAGVYSYAGYFKKGNRLQTVVLILNQTVNNRDKILDLLRDWK